MYPEAPNFEQGWVQRNKVWLLCGAAFLGFAAGIAGFAFWVLSLVGNSGPANLAFDKATANPVLAQRLGHPITKGRFVSGSINSTGPSGHAELAIPVSGPKGAGTLYVEAHKRAGLWELDLLQFGPTAGSERLDLLSSPAPSQ